MPLERDVMPPPPHQCTFSTAFENHITQSLLWFSLALGLHYTLIPVISILHLNSVHFLHDLIITSSMAETEIWWLLLIISSGLSNTASIQQIHVSPLSYWEMRQISNLDFWNPWRSWAKHVFVKFSILQLRKLRISLGSQYWLIIALGLDLTISLNGLKYPK